MHSPNMHPYELFEDVSYLSDSLMRLWRTNLTRQEQTGQQVSRAAEVRVKLASPGSEEAASDWRAD